MIRKNKSLTGQLRDMEIGESMTVNARSGISPRTLSVTAGKLRKEGYDYTLSIVGLPKGACKVTRIEPRERKTAEKKPLADIDVVVLNASHDEQVFSRKDIATTFKIECVKDGEPKTIDMAVTYDQYKWWRKRNAVSEEAGNEYLARLVRQLG